MTTDHLSRGTEILRPVVAMLGNHYQKTPGLFFETVRQAEAWLRADLARAYCATVSSTMIANSRPALAA